MANSDYDIVIAGGGIVGCAAALALANATSYSIAVIEAFETEAKAENNEKVKKGESAKTAIMHPSFDARVVALAKESFKQLNQFGIGLNEQAVDCCPIKHIHVSDRGHLGQVQLQQSNIQHTEDDLGYVVSLAELGQQMLAQLKHTNVDYLCPEKITSLIRSQDKTDLQLSNKTISAKLVLIAEGGQSPSREMFGLSASVEEYAQSAIIANVITQLPHNNSAFERFTSQGPVALLPMQTDAGNQMSLVWTIDQDKTDDVMALGEAEFLNKLQQLFGDKLGRFQAASTRYAYPLSLMQVKQFAAHRVICLGNAAQSLHPIAGQGFNLGIRDIKGLLDILAGKGKKADPGEFSVINAYKKVRTQDKESVIAATDALVRVFSNQYLPFTISRNLSLIALNHNSALKNSLASFAMGER
ncbi:MAG: 2-octaprenyl-6-methoxyphenol hydroxylase [Glaciecola sp.]|jgi:2-octaprenyl-6-methoxyphenol hydroxylase